MHAEGDRFESDWLHFWPARKLAGLFSCLLACYHCCTDKHAIMSHADQHLDSDPPPLSAATRALLQDPDFLRLVKRRNAVSLGLTLLAAGVYYGFLLLLAYGKPVLARPFSGNITLGIPLGIGVILASWLLTGAYVRWANREYDALVSRVRAKAQQNN